MAVRLGDALPHPVRAVLLGECMIEVRPKSPTEADISFGGDALNTAVYLRRALHEPGSDIGFATVVGDDTMSGDLVRAWEAEGLSTRFVTRAPGGKSGLYLVHTDAEGERSFTYYRSDSAARTLLAGAAPDFGEPDLIYLSGITLSILSDGAFENLVAILSAARRRGAVVAFDTNYRAAAWADPSDARDRVNRVLEHVDVALPTFVDERDLFGDSTPELAIERLHAEGVGEVALKVSAEGSLVSAGSGIEHAPALQVSDVIDTTGAGDAFNGAYLAARLQGASPLEAAVLGNRWGAHVIRFGGAIVPLGAMPDLVS